MEHEHEEDDEFDGEEEFDVYEVDDETRNLIEAACNCMVSLAEAQIDPEAAANLMAMADALADRFAINAIELEQHHHSTDDGEETILAPKGGLFPDLPEEEGEAPAVEP
jgi:hypothetical protein